MSVLIPPTALIPDWETWWDFNCKGSRLVKTKEPVRIRKFIRGSLAEIGTPMFCTEKGVRGALEMYYQKFLCSLQDSNYISQHEAKHKPILF